MTVSLPAGIAAQQAQLQQNVALSAIKSSAEADRAIAEILAESTSSVPTGSRGSIVNITA